METQILSSEKISFDKDFYLSLAPADLGIYREERYGGGDFSISIDEFAARDQALLREIYSAVKNVYDLWLYMKENPNYRIFEKNVEFFASEEFFLKGKVFGEATYQHKSPSEMMRKVAHDVRGGAIQTLVSYANYLKMLNLTSDDEKLHCLVLLCRDHAKMMRNAIHDLDIPTLTADEYFRLHSVEDYIKKWNKISFSAENRDVHVTVESDFHGNISTRCLEASSIDRVLYNMMNNAMRFADDGEVKLTLLQCGDLIRWVIENKISSGNKNWLAENVGENLGKLFSGGITNGGNGIGLTNCADIVAASAGIKPERAVADGYIGARIINDTYFAWFHWPKA